MSTTTISKDQAISYLGSISVLEMSKLIKELEVLWGVSAAAPVAVAAAGAASPAAEAQTEFNVILAGLESPDKKIGVIKEVRAITGLGLKEAKDLVEGAPKSLKEGIPKAEADDLKKKLEAAGAKVELK